LRNKGMPGQKGNENVTVSNLEVVDIRAAEHLIFLRGGVPGPKNRHLVIRITKRAALPTGRALTVA